MTGDMTVLFSFGRLHKTNKNMWWQNDFSEESMHVILLYSCLNGASWKCTYKSMVAIWG